MFSENNCLAIALKFDGRCAVAGLVLVLGRRIPSALALSPVVVLVVVLEASRAQGVELPVGMLQVFALAAVAALGGMSLGFVAAALAVAHGFFFIRGGGPAFTFVATAHTRLAFLLITAPAIALGIGLLRTRVDAALTALEIANARLANEVEAKNALAVRMEELAFRDALTGLMNRRAMLEALDREVRRAQRKSRPLSLLMIDVDHFKAFNDTHGHLAGDRALREIAVLTSSFFRGDDVVCRFGGEELVAILPEAGGADAISRADALRHGIEALRIDVGEGEEAQVTVSIGVAAHPDHGCTVEELLRSADDALYEAKRAGRNRVLARSRSAPPRSERERQQTLRLVSG